jgi:hypothetical protein
MQPHCTVQPQPGYQTTPFKGWGWSFSRDDGDGNLNILEDVMHAVKHICGQKYQAVQCNHTAQYNPNRVIKQPLSRDGVGASAGTMVTGI